MIVALTHVEPHELLRACCWLFLWQGSFMVWKAISCQMQLALLLFSKWLSVFNIEYTRAITIHIHIHIHISEWYHYIYIYVICVCVCMHMHILQKCDVCLTKVVCIRQNSVRMSYKRVMYALQKCLNASKISMYALQNWYFALTRAVYAFALHKMCIPSKSSIWPYKSMMHVLHKGNLCLTEAVCMP
jgi:hypothetical protein